MVIIAEGAGQRFIPRPDPQQQQQHYESSNPVFLDMGVWLKAERVTEPTNYTRLSKKIFHRSR